MIILVFTQNAKCNSVSGNTLSLEFVVKQTGGDLSTSAIIDAFHNQLKADAKAKTFTLKVGGSGGKRKKRETTLTADGTLESTANAGCAAGSGTVGTSCSMYTFLSTTYHYTLHL